MQLLRFFFSAPMPCYPGRTLQFNVTSSNMLVNGEYVYVVEGMLELCIGGFLGPVCDIGWDDTDATVFCREAQGIDYGKL